MPAGRGPDGLAVIGTKPATPEHEAGGVWGFVGPCIAAVPLSLAVAVHRQTRGRNAGSSTSTPIVTRETLRIAVEALTGATVGRPAVLAQRSASSTAIAVGAVGGALPV